MKRRKVGRVKTVISPFRNLILTVKRISLLVSEEELDSNMKFSEFRETP